MFVRAYLRASTTEQDATRARQALIAFAANQGHKIAAFYVENVSGARLDRPQLFKLLDDSHQGDVLLIEGVDRLSRLKQDDWDELKALIAAKKVTVVSMDLSTSHAALKPTGGMDDFTKGMIAAVNGMLLDMLAVVARKDYEDRRRRQAEGIATAKAKGTYKGRPTDLDLHKRVSELLGDGKSIRKVAELLKCSTTTVQKVKQMNVLDAA
ncbi:Putative transposon Tn552 DNA-invertase bin3 [Pseudomonas sp. MM227]|uniref:recombinase family protein n=1 Tax=Pseudomonas sp. MM227 TaxID=3019968 RepID=UPI002220C9EF|nr:recombinase family protein [Pseudomonas sp. MM227]CAI3790350.1 Putative transposon Tn552 DNA-invertase bin3 [Pseudomonas sp. MM227]